MIKEYSVSGTRVWKVRDESTGKTVFKTSGNRRLSCMMDWYDARDIVRRVCREARIDSPHCIHIIGMKVYFDAIVLTSTKDVV